jgi:hypothetical protein
MPVSTMGTGAPDIPIAPPAIIITTNASGTNHIALPPSAAAIIPTAAMARM